MMQYFYGMLVWRKEVYHFHFFDQIFRQSGLFRNKWEKRLDYRAGTIRKAIEFKRTSAVDDFTIIGEKQTDDKDALDPLPIIHIADVEIKRTEYLIEKLWTETSVGFISAQPGSFKSWLAEDLGLSVATGTKALGYYQAKKGKVLFFNAEDDPSTNTRQRLAALARSKGLTLRDADFYLFDVHSLHIDDPRTIKRLNDSICVYKPSLVILDPFVGLHSKDENNASDISPILDNLRILNRTYGCSILLVATIEKKRKILMETERRKRAAPAQFMDGAILLFI